MTSENGTHTTHPNCTVGYSMNIGGANLDKNYVVTAGHCGNPGDRWHQGLDPDSGYSDYGSFFGTGTHNNGSTSGGTSNCDCQSIGPFADSAVTNRVLTSNTATYAYTGLPTNTNNAAGYGIGRRVCVSGAAWADDNGGGIQCGTILAQNEETTSKDGSTKITHLIESTILNTEAGDSGAPLGDGGDFMGIHSGVEKTGTKYEVFSRSVYIASVTGATPEF